MTGGCAGRCGESEDLDETYGYCPKCLAAYKEWREYRDKYDCDPDSEEIQRADYLYDQMKDDK